MTKTVTPEGIERLRTLYSIMVGVPTEKVRMSNWRNHFTEDDHLIKGCGTSACAVGWACAYPEFQEQGLIYDVSRGMPVFEGQRNWLAVQRFFGVSQSQAEWLFQAGDEGLAAKQGVLHRIRRMLRENGVITQERSAELGELERGLTA